MKLGINLVGISHLLHKERHPVARTYKLCSDNFYKEVHNLLTPKFDVKVYLTTYVTEEVQNIVDTYKPEKALFLNYKNSHQIKTFINSLELMENQNLNFIMITRFDLFFFPGKLKELDIRMNKFNFLCKEEKYWDNFNFVNDCFMIFPGEFLSPFKKCCYNLLNNPPRLGLTDMHGLYKFVNKEIGNDNINFMTGEKHYVSNCNPIYELKRAQV
jgi:uncharacterized protein YchJ